MAMTTLQRMVLKDAFARVQAEDIHKVGNITYNNEFDIPPDVEIKGLGYEGAVEQVYQQMVQLGQPE